MSSSTFLKRNLKKHNVVTPQDQYSSIGKEALTMMLHLYVATWNKMEVRNENLEMCHDKEMWCVYSEIFGALNN